jgi:hypothetical protein
MSDRDKSGQAFPASAHILGMTLRDYYAGKAMEVGYEIMLKAGKMKLSDVALASYAMADEMLKAREA